MICYYLPHILQYHLAHEIIIITIQIKHQTTTKISLKNKYLGQIHNTKLDTILPNPSLVTSVDNYSISISNDYSPKYLRSYHTNVNNINILPSPRLITSVKSRKN